MMEWLAFLAAAAWIYLLLGHGRFWRIEHPAHPPLPASWPEIVVAVPARDEARVVARAVVSLLRQDYKGRLSVVLADDSSSDGTADVARAAAATAAMPARDFEIVSVPPLPAGWSGKMWAQSHALARALETHPEAELVLLTDADIAHAPDTLSRMVALMMEERRDMVSLMVRLSTLGWIEKAISPAFVFFFRLLYPFAWVADPARATAGAAGGFILVKRKSLDSIGGLAAIGGALIDDCALAKRIKGSGGRIALELSAGSHSLRSGEGLALPWMMIARTAYTQLGHSPWLLAASTLAMLVGFAVPPLAVLSCHGALWGLIAWVAMSIAYAPMLAFYGLPVIFAPFLPLIALFFIGATLDSARRHYQGRGGAWKGRVRGGTGG